MDLSPETTDQLNKLFTYGWMAWFALFALLEGIALYLPGVGDTLSEHVWFLRQGHWTTRGAVFGFWIWLSGHFFFEAWTKGWHWAAWTLFGVGVGWFLWR